MTCMNFMLLWPRGLFLFLVVQKTSLLIVGYSLTHYQATGSGDSKTGQGNDQPARPYTRTPESNEILCTFLNIFLKYGG